MDERNKVNMLDESDDESWSSDDFSEIDDSDADADFILNVRLFFNYLMYTLYYLTFKIHRGLKHYKVVTLI